MADEQFMSEEPDPDGAATISPAARNAAAVIRAYGDLAHDFGNLLLAAQSSLELLRMRMKEPKFCVLADRGLEALDRAGKLLEKLQPLSCRPVPFPPPLDLAGLIRDLVPELKRLAGADVKLSCAVPAVPILVVVEHEQVTLMLTNLVQNARHASAPGGAIEIRLRSIEVEGKLLAELIVSDRGAGMNRVTAARAIEPYFSGSDQTGLGLSQAYALAQRWGGHLTIDSEAGRGTKIRIQLPIAAPPP